MSVTVKKILLSTAISAVLATSAAAQDVDDNFFSGLTTSSVSKTENGDSDILKKIESMMKEVESMDVDITPGENITIEEIDKRNRSSQRLKNDLSLRELKYQEMKSQLEMLMILETARQKTVEANKPKDQEAEQKLKSEAIANQNALTQRSKTEAAQSQMNLEAQERMSIPRVDRISGVADQRIALIESVTGVMQEVSPGDILVNGFKVLDISFKGVTIVGDISGKKYFIAPSAKTEAPMETFNQPTQALDMGTGTLPGMF